MSSTLTLTKLSAYLSPALSSSYRPSQRKGVVHTFSEDGFRSLSITGRPLGRHSSTEDNLCGAAEGVHSVQEVYHAPPSTRIRLNSEKLDSLPDEDLLPMPTISPTSSRSDLSFFTSPTYFASLARYSNSRAFWLALYFALNLLLTLYNKVVLVSFPFPYTLTALHALSGAIGGRILLHHGFYKPRRLAMADYVVLGLFSILYSINIAISNVSLEMVTVPFHQVVRASTPIFTSLFSYYLFETRPSRTKLTSLIPVVIGVGLATYGDYYFTLWGLFLTLLGTLLAASKTIVTHTLQTPTSQPARSPSPPWTIRLPQPINITVNLPSIPSLRQARLNLHPLDLLTRMSPLAFVQCVLYAQLSGELEQLRHGQEAPAAYLHHTHPWACPTILIANAIIAFGLNVVSFEANRRAGALTMGVAANVKQVLTILCAVSLFELNITATNGMGIVLTLVGGGWYGAVEYVESRGQSRKGGKAHLR
ncbi:triose-phosphate transporter family-domain-containing protein [Amylostereum chailletii]|nr:triose-phosphate transporter family-domain-containing protein [Amylostereum chailletii]